MSLERGAGLGKGLPRQKEPHALPLCAKMQRMKKEDTFYQGAAAVAGSGAGGGGGTAVSHRHGDPGKPGPAMGEGALGRRHSPGFPTTSCRYSEARSGDKEVLWAGSHPQRLFAVWLLL